MTALTPAHMTRLAAKTRDLADDFAEAGYVELPDWLRALADITEGKFPCGHEVQGPPVDGREVDRAPEDETVVCGAISSAGYRCVIDRPHGVHMDRAMSTFWASRPPETGDGAEVPPESAAPRGPAPSP